MIGGADVNIPTEDGTYPAHVALDRWAELNMKQHRAECRPGFGVQIGYIIDDPYLNTKVVPFLKSITKPTLIFACLLSPLVD